MESNSSVLVGVCCYYHSFWSSKFVATPGSSSNQLSCGINLHSNPQVKIEKTTCFEYHGGNKQFLFLGGSPSFFVQFRSVSAMIYVLNGGYNGFLPYISDIFFDIDPGRSCYAPWWSPAALWRGHDRLFSQRASWIQLRVHDLRSFKMVWVIFGSFSTCFQQLGSF